MTLHSGASKQIKVSQTGKTLLIHLDGKSMTPCPVSTFLFHFSQQLPRLHLRPFKSFLRQQGALQGPLTCLLRCFRDNRELRTPSAVPLYACRSQCSVKKNWHRPWLFVCRNCVFIIPKVGGAPGPSGPHLTTPLISFDYLMQFNGFLPFQCEWPFNDESKDIQDVMGKVADSEPVQPPIRSLV